MISFWSLFLFLTSFTISTKSEFPIGRCYVHSCDASPYVLKWVVPQVSSNEYCFDVNDKPCMSESIYGCCDIFRRNVEKFVISMTPGCNKSVAQVVVNGVKKGGGIYYDENALKLTALRLNNTNVLNTRICISLQTPCNSIETFCPKGQCKFALFNVDKHTCCPTCSFDSTYHNPTNSFSPSNALFPKLPDVIALTPTSTLETLTTKLNVSGYFTTVKAIQIRSAISLMAHIEKSQINYVTFEQRRSFFNVFFILNDINGAQKSLIENTDMLSKSTENIVPGTSQLQIISVNFYQAPSIPPRSPQLSPSLKSPSLPPTFARLPPTFPQLPLLPLYPLIKRSPPPTCIDLNCPNPNWPREYCNLYPGVPIRCPCLCSL